MAKDTMSASPQAAADTLDLLEASIRTGLATHRLEDFARSGRIPATRIDGRWMFEAPALDAFEQQRAALRAEQMRCLDPNAAAEAWAKKPRFRFRVTAEIGSIDAKGRRSREQVTHDVQARDQTEAWAMFCDRVRRILSPKNTPRTIVRMDQPASV